MLGKRTFVGLLFTAILAQPVMAAPATEEGAGKLLQTFQMYLGKLASGENASVTVKPDGDAYLVSFDLGAALKPFEMADLKIDPAVITTHIAEQDDGTYHVSDLKIPPIVVNAKDSKISYAFDGVSFDGIFDPKIAGFSKAETKFGKLNYDQVAPAATVHVVESDIAGQQTASPVAPGVASIKQQFTIGSITETIVGPDNAQQVAIGFGNTSAEVDFAALKNQAIFDLLAFFVSHQDKAKIVADTAMLKSQLTALLPVFDKLEETVKFANLSVDTQLGRFSLADLGFGITTTGAVEKGMYGFSLSGGKLGYPAALLQPWQANLVPTDFSIGANMTGWNVNAAAKQLIADLDPVANDPLPKESMAKAADALWADGPLKVTFAPSHINAATYQVEMSGDATIARTPAYALHLVVKAKGLSATMDAVGAAKADPAAGQVVGMLAMAKGLGKDEADGTMSWDIDFHDGALTVNGNKLH